MTKRTLKLLLAVVLVGCSSVLTAIPVGAGQSKTIHRSIQELVRAQGTYCFHFPDPTSDCFLFDPPVANYVYFQRSDNLWTTAVDYAGLEYTWLRRQGADLDYRTTFSGSVTERPLADGRAEIKVELHTEHAAARAFVAMPDGSHVPLFGYAPPEVLVGADPALGSSDLEFLYIAPTVGMPLQDFVVPGFIHFEWFESLHFRAEATGPLRSAFGVPDGTRGEMTVDMISTQANCCVREVLNLIVLRDD